MRTFCISQLFSRLRGRDLAKKPIEVKPSFSPIQQLFRRKATLEAFCKSDHIDMPAWRRSIRSVETSTHSHFGITEQMIPRSWNERGFVAKATQKQWNRTPTYVSSYSITGPFYVFRLLLHFLPRAPRSRPYFLSRRENILNFWSRLFFCRHRRRRGMNIHGVTLLCFCSFCLRVWVGGYFNICFAYFARLHLALIFKHASGDF